jgi:hypothetical protein
LGVVPHDHPSIKSFRQLQKWEVKVSNGSTLISFLTIPFILQQVRLVLIYTFTVAV